LQLIYLLAVQVRVLICGWLARLLRMSRPADNDSQSAQAAGHDDAAAHRQVPASAGAGAAVTRRLLIVGGSLPGRQSRSLMANVLDESDLHDRYRPDRNPPPENQQHQPATSPPTGRVDARKRWSNLVPSYC